LHVTEQRKSKRFEMPLPIEIQRAGAQRIGRPGRIRNISSGGVLFTSDVNLELGGIIEYTVDLPPSPGGNVSLRCLGKVLRLERLSNSVPNGSNPSYAIAVTLERYEFQRS
jgi:hypothetical protein